MSLEIVRNNMIRAGFRFRKGQHEAENDWPIYCRRAVGQEPDSSGLGGGAEGSFGDFTYIFGSDGRLWQSYSDGVDVRLRNTLTYVLDLRAVPTFDSAALSIFNLSMRTRDRWLANASYRRSSLLDLTEKQRSRLIRWHRGGDGELSVQFSVGGIADLLLDPVEVEGRNQRYQDYLKSPEGKRRLKAGQPVGFHTRDLSGGRKPAAAPEPQAPRAHVVWLPAQTNGFQHPDKVLTVYPGNIRRLALDHRPADGSILRGWGPDPLFDKPNGVEVSWVKIPKRGRWEAELTTEEAEKIVV